MVVGDSKDWRQHFVTFDRRFLGRIAVVWTSCVALLPDQPTEDQITINLVDLLWRDPGVRRLCHWVEYQYEPFGTDTTGAKFSKGKIDIAAFVDGNDRDRYLAYECKRLNVTYNGRRSSLATEYVKEGMMRFMTEQYAEALSIGCMLGYVMDSDCTFANGQVEAAIKGHAPLGLTAGPTGTPAISNFGRFTTAHIRASKAAIELRHALLPFAKASGVDTAHPSSSVSA